MTNTTDDCKQQGSLAEGKLRTEYLRPCYLPGFNDNHIKKAEPVIRFRLKTKRSKWYITALPVPFPLLPGQTLPMERLRRSVIFEAGK